MYFLFYFLIVILILLFIIIQFFNIISQSTDSTYKKYINILLFVIVLSTVIGVVINMYTIIKNNNKTGNIGDKGIEGSQGDTGNKGRCGLKCGQKVCYLNVVQHANEIFKKEVKALGLVDNNNIKIINKYFLKKLNILCNSDEYFSVLTKEHKNKPSEVKLINYIKDIISKWIVLIINGHVDSNNEVIPIDKNDGKFFFESKNLKFEFLDTYNPNILKELKKYDIFNWGDPTIIKRKKYIIKSDTLKHPSPDEARLYIVKSNNYKPVYNAKSKTDIWDAKKCPYNQLGVNMDNPDNLTKCIYINKNSYKKTYHNTWKTSEYYKPQELSLYIPLPFKNKNNQIFYPVGCVWRGQNNYNKPDHAITSPESSSFCGDGHGIGGTNQHTNKGPEKETILVSGDVVSPEKYELIWSSKKKCPECQINHVQIYRPIAPTGYVALGDIAVSYISKRDTMTDSELKDDLDNETYVKCVPEDCVRKLKLGNKVWDNATFSYNKYSNYLNYTSKIPYKTNKQLGVSLWDGGNSNSGEEIKNNYGVELVENGGYNLFRTSKHTDIKPKMSAYILKQKCLMLGGGKSPKKISFNLDNITSPEEEKYKTTDYFGEKPSMAILTNIGDESDETEAVSTTQTTIPIKNNDTSIYNNINEPKRYYLVDDGNKRNKYYDSKKQDKDKTVPDTYLIKTFNPEKNDFSSCLEYDSNYDNVKIKSYCSKNNKYNKWVVKYDVPNGNSDKVSKTNMSIHPEKDQSYKLINYYDKHGKNINKLVKNDSKRNWIYETVVSEKLPQNKK